MTALPPQTPSDDAVRSVLFVCTGNVCRSPFAELLLRSLTPQVSVTSRGTYALVGQGMSEPMARELALRGPSADVFRSRQLLPEDLRADLVLVMSERQRRLILEEDPAAARRTGLLGHVPELAEMLSGAALTRSAIADWTRIAKPDGRGVPDPYRQSAEVNAGTARILEGHIAQLAGLLQAAGGTGTSSTEREKSS